MVATSEKVEENDLGNPNANVESPEGLQKVINEIEVSNVQLSGLIDNLKDQVKSGKLDTNDGISLLDVKNQMMMSYLTNIVYVIAKKLHGRSIEGDPAIERMVEIRTVLERIRPLEHKLKYMMEKMVKAALTGAGDENDPTHFRANPGDMLDNMAESGSETEEEDGATSAKTSEKKSGLYVPPKLAPMHYDEGESTAERRQRQLERAKKRALHGSVMEELREEYLDTPAELSHGNALKASISKHQRHKNQYEEDYFTRLPTTKKDRHRGRHSMTVGNIGDQLTHFENIQVLEDDEAFTGSGKRRRKSSGKPKSAGKPKKNKGFKRRKVHSF